MLTLLLLTALRRSKPTHTTLRASIWASPFSTSFPWQTAVDAAAGVVADRAVDGFEHEEGASHNVA
jgi:hypothetical protein